MKTKELKITKNEPKRVNKPIDLDALEKRIKPSPKYEKAKALLTNLKRLEESPS